MVKTRKSLLLVLVIALVMSLCFSMLVACDPKEDTPEDDTVVDTNKEYTVTFMMKENGTGDWKQHATAKSKDGKVTLPSDPAVDGFSFRGWFTDENCENAFDENKVTADITVYAHLSNKILTVSIKDGAGAVTELKEQTVANLTTLENTYKEAATKANLTFDGWYTNEACTVKYNAESNATKLYARYVAIVSFEDGYSEIEYTQKVVPGEKLAAIDESKVKLSYMDSIYGYTVLDENGKAVAKEENGTDKKFNMDSKITTNTTLGIMWASKDIKYEMNSQGHLVAVGVKYTTNSDSPLKDVRVVRIPEYAEYEGNLVAVEAVSWGSNIVDSIDSAEKIIFADGIKVINGFLGIADSTAAQVKSIVLPDTLKIIDTAFTNLSQLEEVNIPNGVEIIIDSFWKSKWMNVPKSHEFKINIPSSVKNIAIAPNNFVFADGSPFFYEGNALYKKGEANNYETLIYSYDSGKEVSVKEGVKFIQAGALIDNFADYITLPSTFESVAYNEKAELYPYYDIVEGDFGELGSGFRLYKAGKTTPNGLAIMKNLDKVKKVLVNSASKPDGLVNTAIMGEVAQENGVGEFENFMPNPVFENEDKVVFVGQIEDGQAVNVIVRSYIAGRLATIKSIADVKSNSTLVTEAMILESVGLKDSKDYNITSIKQFGKNYFEGNEATEGKKINNNQYIEVVFDHKPAGVVIEEVNGVLTVIGFDKASAKFDSSKGGYIVTLPNEVEGKPVEAIAASAFEGNGEIVQVNIASNIKTIGDNAFKLASKLAVVLFAEGSKLTSIGVSAFEDTVITTIALPLSNLKEVKPYAFRIKTLQRFTTLKGEENRDLASNNPLFNEEAVNVTGFNIYGPYLMNVTKFDKSNKDFDAQLIACAGGYDGYRVAFGIYVDAGMPGFKMTVNMELMEGSVCYFDNIGDNVVFTSNITKIHENAFTRMSQNALSKIAIAKIGLLPDYDTNDNPNVEFTQEQMEGYFTGKAFQNEDGTLVKWLDGKAFGDNGFPEMTPKNIGVNGTMWMPVDK